MNDIQLVGELVAGPAITIRKRVENLIASIHTSTFDLAEALFEVKEKGYFKPDFESFPDYVDSLDIKQRKAQYLVRIVDVMEQVAIPRKKYEPVGISKLREITSLEPNEIYTNPKTGAATPMSEFIKEFVDRAPGMSLDELKELIRTLKGLTGDNELVWINFCVKKEVRDEVIAKAIELAKANIGSVGRDDEGNAVDASDGRALEMICADYLSDPANQPLEAPLD